MTSIADLVANLDRIGLDISESNLINRLELIAIAADLEGTMATITDLQNNLTDIGLDISESNLIKRLDLVAIAAKLSAVNSSSPNNLESIIFVVSEGNAVAGTDLATIEYFPFSATITGLILKVNEAPTGSNLIADLNRNNVSILSTKISIDATETASTTAATPHVLSSTTLAAGDRLSVNIDQIGATLPGTNVQLIINCVRL